jgi:O-antigen ligase
MTWQPAGWQVGGAGRVGLLPGLLPHPAPAGAPDRGVIGVLGVCIALAAFINPKGPGNTAPWDVLAVLAVFVVFLWMLRTRAPLRLPYGIPMAGLMITGLLAAARSVDPTAGSVAILQELYLLLWCAAVATVCRTAKAIGVLLRVWALSAVFWGAVLIWAVLSGVRAVSGIGTSAVTDIAYVSGLNQGFGTRSRLFFDHPNMAGNYFMIAVFIVLAAGCPRRPWLRAGACAILIGAMFLTGSNAALLSLVAGGVVTLFLRVRARRGLVHALAVVGAVVGVLAIGAVEVAAPVVTAAEQSNNPFIRYSIGRGQRSADARSSLFSSQIAVYEKGDLLGVGPSTTKETLAQDVATTVKQAHNDYLATLVERGPLGLLALFVLICAVFARIAVFTRRPLPPSLAAAVPLPAALGGACAAFALTSLTHETLHYRWLWTLLGVVAAMYVLARRDEPSVREEPPLRRLGDGGPPEFSGSTRAG